MEGNIAAQQPELLTGNILVILVSREPKETAGHTLMVARDHKKNYWITQKSRHSLQSLEDIENYTK